MIRCIECGEYMHEDPNKASQRARLGYRTCIDCGSPPIKPVIIPVAKSNYIVGTLEELKNNNHKGTRTW